MAGVVTIEAEDMNLDTYLSEPDYGGRTVIKVDPSKPMGTKGTATTVFNGQSGTYTIELYTAPENDGASKVALYVGTKNILDVALPTNISYMQTYEKIYEITGVVINNGDEIKIEGISATDGSLNGGAFARIDKMVLSPSALGIVIRKPQDMGKNKNMFPHPVRSNSIRSLLKGNNEIQIYSLSGSLQNLDAQLQAGIYLMKAKNGMYQAFVVTTK